MRGCAPLRAASRVRRPCEGGGGLDAAIAPRYAARCRPRHAVPAPRRLNGARHAGGTAGGARMGHSSRAMHWHWQAVAVPARRQPGSRPARGGRHTAIERPGGDGPGTAVKAGAGRAETPMGPKAPRRCRSCRKKSRSGRAAEAQKIPLAPDNSRRSALGARRSALGARRSALGARRSALICARAWTTSSMSTPQISRRPADLQAPRWRIGV